MMSPHREPLAASVLPPEILGAALAVAGWHAMRLDRAALAALRKSPGLVPAGVEPPSLKHSDDQTVAAFAAFCRAMACPGLQGLNFAQWGIVAGSRFIGRGAVVGTIERYNKEGPWGVSMQVTPHHTVHAISSTLSLALGCHGPCIGAGGGPDDDASALLAALSLLRRPDIGGVWLLFAGWEPEMLIDRAGRPTVDTHCVAAALAVLPPAAEPVASSAHRSVLRISRHAAIRPSAPGESLSDLGASAADGGTLLRAPTEPLALTQRFSQMLQTGGRGLSLRVALAEGLAVEMELRASVGSDDERPSAAMLPSPHFVLPQTPRTTANSSVPTPSHPGCGSGTG